MTRRRKDAGSSAAARPDPRRKSTASLRVSDGAGGMRDVADLRFDDARWAITHRVEADFAEEWLDQLEAVVELRGWSASGMEQLDAHLSSGSKTIHLAVGPDAPAIEIGWIKTRGGALGMRARTAGPDPPPLRLLEELFAETTERTRQRTRERSFRRGWLTYSGLPWTGELWLSETLRMGAPSTFPPSLTGKQVVLVDVLIDGIGQLGTVEAFHQLLRDLSLFLSAMLGPRFQNGLLQHQEWLADVNAQQRYENVRCVNVGYIELAEARDLPSVGTSPPLPLVSADPEQLVSQEIRPGDRCIKVRDDLPALWQNFLALSPKLREQFLSACNAYSVACSLFPGQRTAYATFLVVACETLKPSHSKYDDANLYDVVSALLDADTAQHLKGLALAPQHVRSKLVHRGRLVAGEMTRTIGYDPFADPSFHETLDVLSRVTRLCLLRWLVRGGLHTLIGFPRARKRSRAKVAVPRTRRSR